MALDLIVASSAFLSLISFREALWYCLVFYMQSFITKTRGLLKLSSFIAKQYTANCYLLLFYSQYSYGKLSIFLLFLLLQDAPEEVHFLLFYFDLQKSSYFYHVLY